MSGFADVTTPYFSCAAPTLGPLPEVSFGGLIDKVDGAIEMVSGYSLRREVTDFLVGDTEKLSMQVETWKQLGAAMDAIDQNVTAGLEEILLTWKGEAATAMAAHFEQWKAFLDEQAATMQQVAVALGDLGEQALEMAQVVVDMVKLIMDLVLAGLANAAIPFYGQVKLIKSVKEALTTMWSAMKVIKVFKDLVILTKDMIVVTHGVFTTEAVPSAASATGVPGAA
ncbi:WXG100 family type VII secretion target [Jatrophihabitans sp. YIM 134969]